MSEIPSRGPKPGCKFAERADGTGEDHGVEASMGDDWPSQVARRDIKARKNQACQRREDRDTRPVRPVDHRKNQGWQEDGHGERPASQQEKIDQIKAKDDLFAQSGKRRPDRDVKKLDDNIRRRGKPREPL